MKKQWEDWKGHVFSLVICIIIILLTRLVSVWVLIVAISVTFLFNLVKIIVKGYQKSKDIKLIKRDKNYPM